MKRHPALTLICAAAAVVAAGLVPRSDAAPSSALSNTASHQTNPLLRVGYPIPFSTFDPARGARPTWTGLALEPLVWANPAGRLQPWLAQSAKQTGSSTYVYRLRRGVKFWNGSELTAADVANALNYYRHPTSRVAHIFRSVKNIKPVGRYTVVITLKHRDASWPFLLATAPGIFAKSFQETNKTTFGEPGTLVMGTGPWKVDRLDPTRGIEFSANPNYWRGRVNFRRISVKFLTATSLPLALRAREIDVAYRIHDAGSLTAFASAAGASIVRAPDRGHKVMRVVTLPALNGTTLSMNVRQAPWNDLHVRRAVAYALNRQAILKASGSPGTPRYELIPRSQLYALAPRKVVNALLKSLPKYEFNVAKARREMAKSAYANGVSAEFNTIDFGGYPDMAQTVAAQLAQIKIRLKVNVVSIPAWIDLVFGEKRAASGIQFHASCCSLPDPSDMFTRSFGSTNTRNMADYTPRVLDELIKEALVTSDPVKRLAVYGKILRRVAIDVPYLGVLNGIEANAFSERFGNPSFVEPSLAFRGYGPWPLDVVRQ